MFLRLNVRVQFFRGSLEDDSCMAFFWEGEGDVLIYPFRDKVPLVPQKHLQQFGSYRVPPLRCTKAFYISYPILIRHLCPPCISLHSDLFSLPPNVPADPMPSSCTSYASSSWGGVVEGVVVRGDESYGLLVLQRENTLFFFFCY